MDPCTPLMNKFARQKHLHRGRHPLTLIRKLIRSPHHPSRLRSGRWEEEHMKTRRTDRRRETLRQTFLYSFNFGICSVFKHFRCSIAHLILARVCGLIFVKSGRRITESAQAVKPTTRPHARAHDAIGLASLHFRRSTYSAQNFPFKEKVLARVQVPAR